MICASQFDWTSTGASLEALDDGHTPQGLQLLLPDASSRLASYKINVAPQVHVVDHAVEPSIVQAWYDTMTTTGNSTVKEEAAWGTYVTMDDIQAHLAQPAQFHWGTNPDPSGEPSSHRQYLACAVAAALVRQAWGLDSSPNTQCTSYTIDPQGNISSATQQHQQQQPQQQAVREIWQQRKVHGVAVWALCAQAQSAVPYHLDYAEQVRYATGIVVPPLWGGILHCTPSHTKLQGGDYFVYMHSSPEESFQHYQSHGYKAQRKALSLDCPNRIDIAYRNNRLIAQAGYLPHGSTAVTQFVSSKHQIVHDNDITTARRVVVGLNVFGQDVGNIVQALPEHSPAFVTWVRAEVRRRQSSFQQKQHASGVSLRALVHARPDVVQRLIRAKAKRDYQQAVQNLESNLQQALTQSIHCAQEGVSVGDLRERFGRTDSRYPSPDDILVYLAHHFRATGRNTATTTTTTATIESLLANPQQRVRATSCPAVYEIVDCNEIKQNKSSSGNDENHCGENDAYNDNKNDQEDLDPAAALMQRGAWMRRLRNMELQDEAERQAKDEPLTTVDQVQEQSDSGQDVYSTLDSGRRMLDYASYLAHQRYYDDLKHADYDFIDFGFPLGTDGDSDGKPIEGRRLVIEQDKHLGKGGLCWDAAFILADHVIATKHKTEQWLPKDSLLRVVELGCGTGLCGMMVAKAIPNLHVYLTDLPELVPLISRNVSCNFLPQMILEPSARPSDGDDCRVPCIDQNDVVLNDLERDSASPVIVQVLDWAEVVKAAPSSSAPSSTYDVILGADVVASLYDPYALANTMHALSHDQTLILLSFKERLSEVHRQFEQAIDDRFKNWEILSPSSSSRNQNPKVRIMQISGPKESQPR